LFATAIGVIVVCVVKLFSVGVVGYKIGVGAGIGVV